MWIPERGSTSCQPLKLPRTNKYSAISHGTHRADPPNKVPFQVIAFGVASRKKTRGFANEQFGVGVPPFPTQNQHDQNFEPLYSDSASFRNPHFGKRRYFLTTSGSGQTFPKIIHPQRRLLFFGQIQQQIHAAKNANFSRWPLALSRERSGGAYVGPFGLVSHKRGLKNVLLCFMRGRETQLAKALVTSECSGDSGGSRERVMAII